MKIHKKDKQQMFTGVLKHTPPPASAAASSSSSASDQKSNAQTTVPTIPRGHLVVGPKDQLRLLTPVGSTATSNHCAAAVAHAAKHSGGAPRPPSSLSEEDDGGGGGGGGGRVKKKRKKKDKREWEKGGGEVEESSKPKKRKEEKVATVVTLRKSKEPKEGKERKERRTKGKEGRKELMNVAGGRTSGATVAPGPAQVPVKVPGKRGRKPKVKVLPPVPTNQAPPPSAGVHTKGQSHSAQSHGKNHRQANSKTPAPSAPKQRGRKPRDPGAAPVEKKKKGKRRNQELAVQEGAESDDTTSMSALNMGGEDSQDPLDNAKRRSGRQVKRRKYNEDLDFKVVDDDGETIAVLGAGRISALNATALAWQAEEPPEDEANIIEKILSVKTVKKETSSEDQPEETEEFYVKYRNFSYLHCKWATLEELEKDPRIHQKIKRFRTKQAQMKHLFTEPDEDLFNPDYVEADRVLEVAVTTDTETGEEVTHYLVKWCSLSYEEATWELQEDLDPEKIKEFEEIQKLPPDLRHMERPPPDKWQKLERSRDYRNGNQLREYQLEGMNWLLFNWYNRKNCILADEMGLGKTIQSITFLYEIFSMGIRGPFLIIAPLSTITNWEREFRTWTRMNVIVYHGSQISRQMILQYEMFYRDAQGNTIPGILKFHGVITTFEMIMADCPELKKLHWRCVVIDEAHRLKNRNCKLLEGLKLMNLEHKVLLTGTPLQNSVEELFSLLNFLEPLQFPSESTFLEEFGDLKTDEQVKKLQAILKPMMLRRLKDDVEKNLAPKEETIIEVELTNIQKKYYRAILEKNFSFLSKGANQHNMPNLINTMMELRKCCNHPYLITGAEEKILESFRKVYSPDAMDFQLQAMIQAAGKLVLIDKLLPKLLAGGHKVLVFSQMVRCLDIMEDYLIQRRYTYERIDGRVRGNLRQAAIDRFCKPDSDRFVFLLCTRAGGLGINLTAADTCIIFDSDWNPQNDLQAQARCHRIGQSKAVKVYRLITRNSYEREMFDKASLKLGLDKAVLQDINRKGSLNGVQQLSKLEVEDLLKKGAYGALMDEEDEGSKFCEEDIDQILQRRTQTITIQSEGKGSTFAKASFISSGNRTDISLDDPNFWQKWAKIAEVEIDSKSEKESLVIDTPRVRKQTRHYNSFEDDELMEFSELDSDSEERPCRTRRLGERTRRYLRAECFRVEKNLLIFGWGRWKDILNHGRFKWHLAERDMEVICRALLVYCLRHYKGDDKIKSFIWDLITPTKEGQDQALLNHSGLSAPVPRGRKGKKLKNQLNVPEVKNADWLVHCNPEVVLQDDSYKKHLKQHCNKVLLRVRMLYYLKVEVLGEAANQALEGIPASKLEVSLPDIDYIEIPAPWWDADADKSLLIGVHKHGYERYNAMRADSDLCFLERVGMPDVTALSAEQGGGEGASDMADSVCKTEEAKDEAESKADGGEDRDESSKGEETCSSTDTSDKPDSTGPDSQMSGDLCAQDGTLVTTTTTGTGTGVASLHVIQARPLWPTGPALTARLRRLITAYQRFTLRREPLLRHDFLLHDGLVSMGIGGAGAAHSHHTGGPLAWQLGEELRRCSVVATEPDPLFLEWQRRWTRREQADFYRTVSSFGVVYDPERKSFDWSQFRALARLERKTDESLERYFNSFVNMCRTACKLPPRKEEGLVDPAVLVEPLTEERAARTLYRIELLRKIREQVLRHPLLSARLQLCRPSLYLPVWWESGKHDRDLLIGAARHGLSRTDFYILNDPQLAFLEAHRNYVRGHPSHLHPQSHHHPHHPGLVTHPGISSSSSSSHPQLPHPHCCLYDSNLGRHSPQPPEYPHQSSHHHHHHHQHHSVPPSAPSPSSSSSSSSHPHLHPLPLDAHNSASPSLGIVPGSRGDFLDCPPLDETLELGSLQHDAMSADALHGGKASKDALNGFPFNSAAGGQSMLNSYGVGGTDLDSKLRSDVLVGEQGSSEETGLMAPSVELDQLQAPWDGTDHSSPAHHMFNESDPILGPSTLETGFLEEEDEEAQGGDRGGEEGGTLEECLGLPPSSSPSHPSAGDSVEPLSSSYMLFKEIGVSEEPSADQTDLSASPPPPYVPPPPLSLSDITAHTPQHRLGPSDVAESLANPVEEGEGQEGGTGFEFDDKEEEEVEDLSGGTLEQNVEKQRDLEGVECDVDQGADQSLGVLNPPMEVPQMDGIVPEPGLAEQDEQDLQESFNQAEHEEELPQGVHPYLGKLEQESSLACPESIEEPGEEVDGLILYQTVEEETIGNSLDTETLMGNAAGEDGPAECTDLADQVDEISEGQMDHVSFIHVPVVQPSDDVAVKQLDVKPNEMVLQSIYSEYAQPSCPTTSVSPPTVAAKADETATKSSGGAGVKTEVSMNQNNYEGTAEDLSSPHGRRDCKNRVLTFSLDQDNKNNLLEQIGIKMAPTLPANSIDTKPSDLKFSFLPEDSGVDKKPQQLELPIKVEETKTEAGEDVYPDSSEVKHGNFLSYRVKSEDLVTKAEQLDYPVKPETLETKPEDLSLPMKPESLDCKPEVLQFAAFSDGAEIKPEEKPVALSFAAYPDGAKLKTETEQEDLRLSAFPDTSAIKPEAKPEGLEFTTYPDSSEIKPEAKPEDLEFTALPEIKAETKQELLEADSTVLTPKLEQVDGLVDTSESLVVKGQVKEERPTTPVPVVEGYAGSPRFAAPVSMCEIPESLHDTREPTIAQLLQEKALYSFSEWPKDRVIINRLDSICHAILKGKWPSSSEQYDSPGSMVANSCLANSLAQHHHQQHHRAGFLPTTASSSVPGQSRVQQTNPGLGFSIPPPLTRLPKYMSRGGACGRGAWRLTSLPLLQERLVAPPYLPELKRAGGRRSFDYEAAAAAAAAKVLAGKSASSCHTAATTSSSGAAPVVAPPSHRTGAMLINGWQETAIDLTKSSGEISTTSALGTGEAVVAPGISHHGAGSSHKLPPPPPITAPLSGSVGIDMAGILQAGLIHPVTGQIVNGSLRGDDSLRRRRGRRRNVEALYSEFTKSRGLHLPETQLQGRVEVISHSSVSSSTSSPSPSPSERPAGPPTPSSSSTPTPTQTPPQPEIVAIDREAASKGLIEWLRQNPGYSMDLPTFTHSGAGLLHGFVERPKQRRHRCKDPTKLDINSLTGEERVPVVHRGTGRRLGGAMAPAIKELSRWLDANSEYYVAPDWADVVKHSGFLPEGKFSRILTEPVNRDSGSRRRGRRPRSEMPKPLLSVSDSATSGLGPPLFMNGGLIGSMDSMVQMQNLRGGIPGIPISGIMAAGFPHGFSAAVQAGGAGASAEDAKNGLSMLPMMLHGIPHPHGAAIPQHALFSVGAMMAHTPPPPPPHPSSSSSSSLSAAKVTTTTAPSTSEAASPSSTTPAERESTASSGSGGGEKERSREEKGATEANKRAGVAEAAAIITSTSRAHIGAAHLGGSTGSHLTFNPFLIPGMSHGLLYPHMFLPHGGIMALPAMPPGAVDGSPGSPKRRRKRGREEGEREEEREKAAVAGKVEERESTVKANVTSHPASSSSPSIPSTSAPDPGLSPTEEPQTGQGDAEDGSAEPQEPDSHNPLEGAATEEKEERLEDTGGKAAAEEEKRDSEEQRQVEGEEA
ncbi:chromodomain-helicase-DNA-binding protein 6 isoform X1 [Epinephelus moara]|uniref:chromodomain-helicase-DNA-binding protein 6 isoform X1 n=1 Tax=Epinephelus moara TaxID=300413 RepID=UPI00214EA5BA|nr:chromodomain-helicase-DNA-binding protein 6 isoform X1 [Epinephelus moara]XP_049893602.1 chromodomain-helicase-DNA-binding protein 6 isoform X1 [Epinephelus moara]XP_049893603.1 chromodomain-helicase-DNA-binding protein 6 isoform X1 [Epinephelus moara]